MMAPFILRYLRTNGKRRSETPKTSGLLLQGHSVTLRGTGGEAPVGGLAECPLTNTPGAWVARTASGTQRGRSVCLL
jgi:hypothetical protein